MYGRSTRNLARGAVLAVSLIMSALAVPRGGISSAHASVVADVPRDVISTVIGIDDGRLIVKIADTSDALGAAAALPGTGDMRWIGPDTWVVDVDDAHRSQVLSSLARRDDVEWVEPDRMMRSADLPNDPDLVNQTYLSNVGAADAWNMSRGSTSVVVAVLDTLVDLTHPDLVGKLLPGSSFITGCPDGSDVANHGTLVAGIIGASTDNSVGIAGLGWNTRVLPLQVLCDNGFGLESSVAPAIRYAADAGAGIINLSLAADGAGTALREAVAYAQSKGALVVAAAGNKGSTLPQYPAALAGVVAVGATTTADVVAPFSNRGTWVDIVAPGTSIYSTIRGGGYSGGWPGTSFAAPMVSATAALIVAVHPGITASGVVARLRGSAAPIAGTGSLVSWGRLDAAGALAMATRGAWLVDASGAVLPMADAPAVTLTAPAGPIVALASTPKNDDTGSHDGFWVTDADGRVGVGVASGGSLRIFGDLSDVSINKPIVGMASTPSGEGYWLVASDGGIFAFGDAVFYGSTGSIVLNKPIVGMASTPSGEGYWLVASDGGIFAFGDAVFYGSTGSIVLNKPIVGMASTPTGSGYWMVADDGGVFAFGDAGFYGSTGNLALVSPVFAMLPSATGQGYSFVAGDGGVFTFGDAPFLGSGVGAFANPVVALTPL